MSQSPIMQLGARIKQARIGAGLSLRGLADKMDNYVSAQVIHKYELGKSMPGSDVLLRLGKALGVKTHYFFRPERFRVDLESPAYRKRLSASVKSERALLVQAGEHVERFLQVEALFPKPETSRTMPRPHEYVVKNLEDVEDHARDLRRRWRLGLDPVPRVIEVLEDCGVKVFVAEIEDEIDGLSSWANGSIPIVVVRRKQQTDRFRFSVAHELGHLVLDVKEARLVERAANRFAAAFLAPRESVLQEIGEKRTRLTLTELRSLREKYGLSVQSWIMRAKDLGIISASYTSAAIAFLKAQGLYDKELGDPLPKEEPTRFARLVIRAVQEDIASHSRGSELLGITIQDLRERLTKEGVVARTHT